MKNFFLVALFLMVSTSVFADQRVRFPRTPNLTETPGKLCSSPTTIRYPEKINYCERDVDSYLKNAVIQKYDRLFGYEIRTMNRADFKIDHLIPLCAGGANSEDNLWPQHKSVYAITDPLEPIVCQKMQEGKLLQADAIKLVLQAKTHLEEVPAIIKQVKAL